MLHWDPSKFGRKTLREFHAVLRAELRLRAKQNQKPYSQLDSVQQRAMQDAVWETELQKRKTRC